MRIHSVARGSRTGTQRRRRRVSTLVTALLVGAAGLVAAPASAHGGDLQVDLGTDGAGGIDASVTWAADGHPVEETVDLIVTAVSDDGEEVGPVQLQSASEGVGWYRSEPGLLGEGHWVITSEATEPEAYSGSTEIDVAAVVAPVSAEEPEPGPETTAADDSAASDVEGSGSGGWIAVGVAALVALVAVGTVIILRRRAAQQN